MSASSRQAQSALGTLVRVPQLPQRRGPGELPPPPALCGSQCPWCRRPGRGPRGSAPPPAGPSPPSGAHPPAAGAGWACARGLLCRAGAARAVAGSPTQRRSSSCPGPEVSRQPGFLLTLRGRLAGSQPALENIQSIPDFIQTQALVMGEEPAPPAPGLQGQRGVPMPAQWARRTCPRAQTARTRTKHWGFAALRVFGETANTWA